MHIDLWHECYGDRNHHSYRVEDWRSNLEAVCRITTVRDWQGISFIPDWRIGYFRHRSPIFDSFDPCNGRSFWTEMEYLQKWCWRERVITGDREHKKALSLPADNDKG